MSPSEYNYETAGFDGFFNRSIDTLSQSNLDAQGPLSTSVRFDSAQVSGIIGEQLRSGNTKIVGDLLGDMNLRGTLKVGDNLIFDGENDRISVTNQDDKENVRIDTKVSTYDDNGNLMLTQGKLADNTFGLGAYDSSNILRLLAGRYPDGSVKIKLSQPTYDVSKATDDQLIWSSDFNTFKITQSGTTSITTVPDPFPGATEQTVSVAHGLSAKPMVLAWVDAPATGGFSVDAQTAQVPTAISFTGGTGGMAMLIYINVDSTNITFHIRNVSGAGLAGVGSTWVFRYYIVKETAATS